jgi:hypothetical protein
MISLQSLLFVVQRFIVSAFANLIDLSAKSAERAVRLAECRHYSALHHKVVWHICSGLLLVTGIVSVLGSGLSLRKCTELIGVLVRKTIVRPD